MEDLNTPQSTSLTAPLYLLTQKKGAFGLRNRLPGVRVRVSGGHLCGAEAPTEAAAETLLSAAKLRGCYRLKHYKS